MHLRVTIKTHNKFLAVVGELFLFVKIYFYLNLFYFSSSLVRFLVFAILFIYFYLFLSLSNQKKKKNLFVLVYRLKEPNPCQDARAHLTHAGAHSRISQHGAHAPALNVSAAASECTPRVHLRSIAHHLRLSAPPQTAPKRTST
jgi:Zn-dependent protease with chaperone function